MSNTITYPRNPKELNKSVLLNLVLNDSENFQIIHNEISKDHSYCVLVRMKEVSEVSINDKTCYEIASMEFHVIHIFNQNPNLDPFAINDTLSNGFVNLSSAEDVEKHQEYHNNFGDMLCLDVHLTNKESEPEPKLFQPNTKLILEKDQVLHFSIFVDEVPVDIENEQATAGKQCSTRTVWIDRI
ncbi:hypothetical protein [Aquimarina sp. 2201CG5-10]|uniref:hypothetical protein n=1 Tax=Aquimarina callyspongiae TaxID=3098150 RepID=UPI002AB3AC15|nr:hypothetical protein [Aquimarina sp. 2201CG5-10]MDY8134674.1 hypothetical protein [Aquimarina sp. 2201CG5-10]